MNSIKAAVHNGMVEAMIPSDWPEGTEVRIERISPKSMGMRDEDWPTNPEGIAELVRCWDALEPLEMTAEEEKSLADWRKMVNDFPSPPEPRGRGNDPRENRRG